MLQLKWLQNLGQNFLEHALTGQHMFLFAPEHDGSGAEVVLDQFADQVDQIHDSESPAESILVSVHQEITEQNLDEYNYYISSRVPVHTDPENELELSVSGSLQGVNYDLEYQNIPVAKRFCSMDDSSGYQPFVHWSVPKEMASEDSEPVDLQHQDPQPVNLRQPINKRVSLI